MMPLRAVAAAVIACLLSAGCSNLGIPGPVDPGPGPDRGPEQAWPEVFEFVMQPGDLNGPELEARITAANPMGGEPVPGTSRHVGWVNTPGGRVDFFQAQMRGSEMTFGPMWCTIRMEPQGSGASCGDEPNGGADIGLREMGGSVSATWQSWEIGVADDGTASIAGVTEDGAEYTIIPTGRFAFVMWRSERGRMTLTSLDAEGNELQSITIGELP